MRTQSKISWLTRALPIALIVLSAAPVFGQTRTEVQPPTPTPAPTPARRRAPRVQAKRVIVEGNLAAPQVVTILHTLSGLKVIRLLNSKKQIEIVGLDQDFKIAGEVHTNVIAGLALDDGHTIAAWLPEAEAELPPRAVSFPAPVPPAIPGAPSTPPPGAVEAAHAPTVGPSINFNGNLLETADLRVITREGKRIAGRYIGLDGLTGLSLITLPGTALAHDADSSDEALVVGQKLRVVGPQPVAGQENGARSPMYIRIAETEAVVVGVTRSPSGGMAKVRIKSSKLSPANIGGIAINEDGETLGIVSSVKGEAATIVPMALVRSAAKRVLARQASVPRPWLGVRGEPIAGAVSFERLQRVGWEIQRARALADKRQGILLTSITPNSPAAAAKLKPGDVILSVNNDYIQNAEEFSWLLDEAGPGSPVRFKIARPGNQTFEFDIKLSESPDYFFGLKQIEESIKFKFTPLFGEGVETVPLKPKVAVRLGSSGGLLVVSVQPSTAAFKAGLREGDVIESINGQPLYSGNATMWLPKAPGTESTYTVVRNKQKVSISFKYSDKPSGKPPGTPQPQ